MSAPPPSNSLGLDLDNLRISESATQDPSTSVSVAERPVLEKSSPTPATSEPAPSADQSSKEDEVKGTPRKKDPYINHERVKTGGAPRDKLTDDELKQRMARMREQNEKIKQRRMDVQADEDAFKRTQEAERQRQAKIRKVQEGVDRTREQNAWKKMEKIQSREWDSGKKGGEWSKGQSRKYSPPASTDTANPVDVPLGEAQSFDAVGVVQETSDAASPGRSSLSDQARGKGSSRSRGRGRGRGGNGGASNAGVRNGTDSDPAALTTVGAT